MPLKTPNLLKEIGRGLKRVFAKLSFYESTQPSTFVRWAWPSTRHIDKELTEPQRQYAVSTARELQTNSALAAGLVDTHIQYMGTAKFKCNSPYPEFNIKFQTLLDRWKKRKNCEITESYCFDELLQIIERHRITDGDVMILKCKDGKIQVIEGDRVRTAQRENDPSEEWIHGVKCNYYGKVVQYHIAKRLPEGGFEDEKHISADKAWLIGYRRNVGQRRGVSPLIVALRELTMLNKSMTAAVARELLTQMMVFVTKRDVSSREIFPNPNNTRETINQLNRQVEESLGIDKGAIEGLKHLGLNHGDIVELLQSNNPSSNTQAFWEMAIRLVLYSLRIPYSFYDATKTNFYGTRGEFERYLDSCESSQLPLMDWLTELTEWLLAVWVEEELIDIPFGETLESMGRYFEWSNGGMPYFIKFDFAKDVIMAAQTGLINPIDFAARCGEDFEINIKKLAQAIKIIDEHGVPSPYKIETKSNTISN